MSQKISLDSSAILPLISYPPHFHLHRKSQRIDFANTSSTQQHIDQQIIGFIERKLSLPVPIRADKQSYEYYIKKKNDKGNRYLSIMHTH